MQTFFYKWILIIVCAAVFILCDTLSAHWGRTNHQASLVTMLLLAPMGYIVFGQINRSSNLAISSGLVNMILIIGTIMVSIFYFRDALTIRQIFGLGFAITAVGLMI